MIPPRVVSPVEYRLVYFGICNCGQPQCFGKTRYARLYSLSVFAIGDEQEITWWQSRN